MKRKDMPWSFLPRVFRAWVDKVTGARAEPGARGAVPTDRWVFEHGGKLFDVKPSDFNIDEPIYQLNRESRKAAWKKVEDDRHAEHAQKQLRKRKKQGRKAEVRAAVPEAEHGARLAYRSAGQAADEFLGNNQRQLEGFAQADIGDAVREWMDGFEVKRGRSWKKAAQTSKGKQILADINRSAGGNEGPLFEILTWLFSQSKRKRWDEAPWSLIDELADSIQSACEDTIEQHPETAFTASCGGWEWYPIASGALSREEVLHRLPDYAQAQAADEINADELGALVKEAREAVKAAASCLTKDDAKVIKRRLALLADMVADPKTIGEVVCGTERARVCGFEAIRNEVRRINRACKRAVYEEGKPITLEELEDLPTSEKNPSKRKRAARTKANPSNPWGELTDLEAQVIEVEVRNPDGSISIHTWHSRRPSLYWSPKKRALVWVHNGAKPKQLGAQAPPGKAADVYKRWNSRRATDAAELSIPSTPLKVAGPALRIVYTSKRYRDGIPRHHDFGSGVLARKAPSGQACVWQVSGGKLKATRRGLVG